MEIAPNRIIPPYHNLLNLLPLRKNLSMYIEPSIIIHDLGEFQYGLISMHHLQQAHSVYNKFY